MLRDLLTQLDDFVTWPCDEINYIWRHGNRSYPSDEFPASLATDAVKEYINNEFDSIKRHDPSLRVLEKTCANSLRVPFVESILNDATYIFIVRDGFDVVASASKRWKAKLDIPYILRKVRYIPPSDIPYYAYEYLVARLFKLFSKEKRLKYWGPRLDNIDKLLQNQTLAQVCATQWKQCVESAANDLSAIPDNRVYKINYDEFVAAPAEEFLKLTQFLGIQLTTSQAERITSVVTPTSIGKSKREVSESTYSDIAPIISSAKI
jgi:hypothetical protein